MYLQDFQSFGPLGLRILDQVLNIAVHKQALTFVYNCQSFDRYLLQHRFAYFCHLLYSPEVPYKIFF